MSLALGVHCFSSQSQSRPRSLEWDCYARRASRAGSNSLGRRVSVRAGSHTREAGGYPGDRVNRPGTEWKRGSERRLPCRYRSQCRRTLQTRHRIRSFLAFGSESGTNFGSEQNMEVSTGGSYAGFLPGSTLLDGFRSHDSLSAIDGRNESGLVLSFRSAHGGYSLLTIICTKHIYS